MWFVVGNTVLGGGVSICSRFRLGYSSKKCGLSEAAFEVMLFNVGARLEH